MGKFTVYIRSGFGNTLVSSKKPICIPLFHSLSSLERDLHFHLNLGIETGIISKDSFFVDLKVSVETITKNQEDVILEAFAQGKNRESILKSNITEHLRQKIKTCNFSDIPDEVNELQNSLTETLTPLGIEILKLKDFEVKRTGLDEYDLDNVLHFKMAKEIVTKIARVKIKDKSFIDRCRKTISHFDIVDEE